MCDDLVLVVSNRRLCNWAYIASARLQHVRVIRRKNSRCCTDYRAQRIVHLLCLGLLDRVLECGARCRRARVVAGDRRVRLEVVVVVGRCSYYWALREVVSGYESDAGECSLEYLQSGHPL
jgi:hypothetical protein